MHGFNCDAAPCSRPFLLIVRAAHPFFFRASPHLSPDGPLVAPVADRCIPTCWVLARRMFRQLKSYWQLYDRESHARIFATFEDRGRRQCYSYFEDKGFLRFHVPSIVPTTVTRQRFGGRKRCGHYHNDGMRSSTRKHIHVVEFCP